VAVEKRLVFPRLAEERVEDLLRGQRRRQRQVAAADAFGDAHQVGRDGLVVAREHFAGPAEADGHFVGDEEDVVAVA
jgi:hypothetical protein